ncbi:MAG TPA: TolC family protein [Polyangia bacterium]|jgi:cobalt-zinc-cadmium efflux system outer membrane protein|nr:TolC family protein [Polyangia bacterium]
MSRSWAAIALAVVSLSSSAGALAAPATVRLSLEEALALAERHSPLVARARQERLVTAANRVGAGAILPTNPALSVSVGRRRDVSGSQPPATGPEVVGHLEQTIEVANQRGARLAEVAAAVDVALARERFATVEARARARQAYLGVLIAERFAESARRREQLGLQIYDSAKRRLEAGAGSDVELHLAEVERGRLAGDRVTAELAVAQARADLRLLLGLPILTEKEAPLELTTPLTRPGLTDQGLEDMVALARARRADLESLLHARTQLDAALVRLRREVVPSPTLYVDIASQQPGQLYVGAGVGFNLPLWRRRQGEIAQVDAERGRLFVERDLMEREIAVEVAQAYRRAQARSVEADLWEREVVPAAEANVGLITEGWRAGKFDLFRVIQASREAGEARRRLLEVLGEFWQAVIELDRATGASVFVIANTSTPRGTP